MSDELKPCPWEKPGERHDLEMVDVGALVWVRCATCMAAGPCDDSREEAAAAWNDRAAVTDGQLSLAVHDGRAWQVVRECKLEECTWDNGQCTWGCRCTACGGKFEHTSGITWNFCPKCGAKVAQC